MKEATGELSMTAIVVVLIGVIAVIAPVVIRTTGNTLKLKTACQASYGCDLNPCQDDSGNTATCYYIPDPSDTTPVGDSTGAGGSERKIQCACRDLGFDV